MIAAIYEFVLNRPSLLRAAAALLWRCGCFGLFAGMLAKSINAILDVVASMGTPGQHIDYQTLFPDLPMWWVPESMFGLAVYLAVTLAGYALHILATEIQRLSRCHR